MKQKIYVVWTGKQPGIYTSWAECERQVKGFAGAKYKSFATMSEAEQAYSIAPSEIHFSPKKGTKKHSSSDLGNHSSTRPTAPYLAVDAACSGNPGKMEFRAVIADTGAVAFHRGPYEDGTNNIGEFLAIVLGLAWLKQQKCSWPIYSDSKIALGWLKKKHVATKLQPNDKNVTIFESIRTAERWLMQNTYDTQVLHWNTKEWGEIPADFGRK